MSSTPEALLLVDHHEAEVPKADVLLEHPVSADHDVEAAGLEPVDDDALLGAGAQAREHLDGHGHRGEALGEGVGVLLREHGRGREDRDLIAVGDRLEGGADGDFGLAVADIADHDPVHRAGGLLIASDLLDRAMLLGRLDVGEAGFELDLPRGVGAHRDAGQRVAAGVDVEQLLGDVTDRALDAALGAAPLLRAEAGQRGALVGCADVGVDAVQLVGRDQQAVVVGVAEVEILTLAVADALLDEALEAGDAVLDVDHVVAGLDVVEQVLVGLLGGRVARGPAGALLGEPEDLGV